jgi:hypothetical protein
MEFISKLLIFNVTRFSRVSEIHLTGARARFPRTASNCLLSVYSCGRASCVVSKESQRVNRKCIVFMLVCIYFVFMCALELSFE